MWRVFVFRSLGGRGRGLRDERRRLDLVSLSTIELFPSTLSLSLPQHPTNAPAQPQEVPRGHRSIVAEEIDDQVAARGLQKDRHRKAFLQTTSKRGEESEKNDDGFFFPHVKASSLSRKNTSFVFFSFFSTVSGSSAPEPYSGKNRDARYPLVFRKPAENGALLLPKRLAFSFHDWHSAAFFRHFFRLFRLSSK